MLLFTVTSKENMPANIKDSTSDTSQDMTGAVEHISVKRNNATVTEKSMINPKMYNLNYLLIRKYYLFNNITIKVIYSPGSPRLINLAGIQKQFSTLSAKAS